MKSMTGYGLASHVSENLRIHCEIKCLNSKTMNIGFHSNKLLGEHELRFRKKIEQSLIRGRVDVFLYVLSEEEIPVILHTSRIKEYFHQLNQLSRELQTDTQGILQAILHLEGVVEKKRDSMSEHLIEKCFLTLEDAIKNVNEFRQLEGTKIKNHLLEIIDSIRRDFFRIREREPLRTENLKEKWKQQLREMSSDPGPERLYQELLFFAERMDIREEMDRFQLHLEHILQTMEEECSGRKLVFFCQELHREINTLSNKAADGEIQKNAVLIKENIEKFREQAMNIL